MWIITVIIGFICVKLGESQFPLLGYRPQQDQKTSSHNIRPRQDFVYPDFYFPSNDQTYQDYFGPQTRVPSKRPSVTQKASSVRPYQSNVFLQSLFPGPNRLDERISQKKCSEYSALIEKKIQVSALSLGSSTQEFTFDQCDISTGLIVGGIKANDNEFPHMGAVGYSNLNREIIFACGASLISERFLVTAAHCRRNGQFPAVVVRLGVLDLASSKGERLPEDYSIQSFTRHENYNSRTKENDIAVIRVSRDVSFDNPQKIRPACLWQTENIGQSSAIAAGWGYTQYAGSISNELMKVRLDLLDNNICAKTFEDDGNIAITGKQICAGVLSGGYDTCQGDSGGPIQIVLPDNKCVSRIIGITSFGGYCGGKNSPSIYTRVSSYIDWIDSKVWG